MLTTERAKYRDVIDPIVRRKLEEIKNGNGIKAGHNGPYYDPEREGRNISHWICIFSQYYKHTGEDKYKEAIEKLSEYYYTSPDYTSAGVYYCRDGENRDSVNGTIGQAWIIEGLIAAATVLKDDMLYEKAVSIFKTLPFDFRSGMWERIETDGTNIGVDITYNHQLWFAAAGAELCMYKEDTDIKKSVERFLDKSFTTLWVMPSGVVCHFSNYYDSTIQRIKNIIKYIKHSLEIMLGKASLEYKEIGYHLFDLYGLALLKEYYPNHKLFLSGKVKKALYYPFSGDYRKKLFEMPREKDRTCLKSPNVDKMINTYAFPYNSPAFELPYVLEQFVIIDDNNLCGLFWNYQVEKLYDCENLSFSRNTEDSDTMDARIYELVRSTCFWERKG